MAEHRIDRLEITPLSTVCLENEYASVRTASVHMGSVKSDFFDCFQLGSGLLYTVIGTVFDGGGPEKVQPSDIGSAIRKCAGSGVMPERILKDVLTIFQECRFTVFIGAYDHLKGIYTYASGGFVSAFFSNGRTECLKSALSNDFTEYNGEVIHLIPGDMVMLCTEGVSAAANAGGRTFGEEGIQNSLGHFKWGQENCGADRVMAGLTDFVQEADLAHDATVLSFMALPEKDLLLKATTDNLERIFAVIKDSSVLSVKTQRRLCLVAEEIFVNICSYAYGDEQGWVLFSFHADDSGAVLKLIDAGLPFDPLEDQIDIDSYDIDAQVGGLGRFLTVQLSSIVDYEYTDNKNILTISMKQEEM